MKMPEIINHSGQVRNLLACIQEAHEEATKRLVDAELPQEVIADFAVVAGVCSRGTENMRSVAEASLGHFYNSVTGLMFETRAKPYVLDEIRERVINGDEELAVIITDMRDLKGINVDYGENEEGGDKAMGSFAQFVERSIFEKLNESGKDMSASVTGVSGEGSDTIKIVVIGKDIYHTIWELTDVMKNSNIVIQLKNIKTGKIDDVKLTGAWGFWVITRDEIGSLKKALEEYESFEEGIYGFASDVALDRLKGDQYFPGADVFHKILTADTLAELIDLREEVNSLGARIPQNIVRFFNDRIEELSESLIYR